MARRELGEGTVGERDRHQQVAGADGRLRLVLHGRVDAIAHDVEAHVGEAQGGIGHQLDRLGLRRGLEQQAVVVELAQDDDAIGDGVGATAVLVDARTHVEPGRDVGELAVRRSSQQDHAALLLGT